MWCILRCHSGYENEVIQSCRQHLAGQGFSDVFTFTYDRMKRYKGAWHLETGVLFPGYVFLEVDAKTDLFSKEESKNRSLHDEGKKHFVQDRKKGPLTQKAGGDSFMQKTGNAFLTRDSKSFFRMQEVERISDIMISVPRETETVLRKLCGENHHLPMSEGYIRDGVTHVTSGPLVGMEHSIRRIDRHKRLARIGFPLGAGEQDLPAGLEIVSKS